MFKILYSQFKLTFASLLKFILFSILLVLALKANAFSNFPGAVDAAAKSLFGATASYTYSCAGCHGSQGFTLATGFGVDFKASALSLYPTVSIGALSNTQVQGIIQNIQAKDSDNDTATNQNEFMAGTNPGDPASKPAPVCTRANPTLAFTTASQTAVAGTAISYQLKLTNNDSSGCANSTFALDQVMPTGLTGTLSVQSIILAPGANQNFSVSINTLATLVAGSYNFSINSTNSGATTFKATANGTLIVTAPAPTPTCTPKAPEVILNPVSQNAVPGDTKKFQLSVKNLDSVECKSVAFMINSPAVTNLNIVLSAATLNLLPGQSGIVNVDASVANTLATSTALSFAVNTSSTSSTLHTTSTKGTINVSVTTNTQDTTPPTKPEILRAIKRGHRVKVSWSASTDDSMSVTYKVMIDGMSVGETQNTSMRLAIPSGSKALIVRATDPSGNYVDSTSFDLSLVKGYSSTNLGDSMETKTKKPHKSKKPEHTDDSDENSGETED